VTLYWLLTGRRPFDGNTEPMTIDNIMRRDPLPPRAINPLVPATVDAVVMQLLQKDVSKRIPNGLEVAEKLLAMLGPSSSYAAAAQFLAHVAALPDDPAGQPISVITIVAARPESQWLKKIDSQSEVLERIGPQLLTPPNHQVQLPVPLPSGHGHEGGGGERTMEDGRMPTGKTVTGVNTADLVRQAQGGTPVWPVLAGVAAALVLGVGGWQLMRAPAVPPVAPPVEAPPADATAPAAPDAPPSTPPESAPDAPPDAPPPPTPPADRHAQPPPDPSGAQAAQEPAEPEPAERARRSSGNDDRPSVKASSPGRISWRVNGKFAGKGNTTLRLPKGGGKVTAFDPDTGGTSVVPVVDGAASWSKLGQGTLVVRARPWAEVKLGPKGLGQTPFDPISLVEGHYEVVLIKEGVTKRVGVDVSAGKTATLNVDMRE
jgi:hypothetical protein